MIFQKMAPSSLTAARAGEEPTAQTGVRSQAPACTQPERRADRRSVWTAARLPRCWVTVRRPLRLWLCRYSSSRVTRQPGIICCVAQGHQLTLALPAPGRNCRGPGLTPPPRGLDRRTDGQQRARPWGKETFCSDGGAQAPLGSEGWSPAPPSHLPWLHPRPLLRALPYARCSRL